MDYNKIVKTKEEKEEVIRRFRKERKLMNIIKDTDIEGVKKIISNSTEYPAECLQKYKELCRIAGETEEKDSDIVMYEWGLEINVYPEEEHLETKRISSPEFDFEEIMNATLEVSDWETTERQLCTVAFEMVERENNL